MAEPIAEQSTTYLLDNFVTMRPGEPYRLFPFGKVVKGGKTRNITPELARRFRLPHWKPAIKLGSHREETPAGGHILSLEVREDGLWAIPEINDKGTAALNEGAYRYHSPEVIWEDGTLENPQTGERTEGPFIVGDALLHNPHLGEAAALYSVEPIGVGIKENAMTDSVSIPSSLADRFNSWLDGVINRESQPPQPSNQEPQASPEPSEQYTALTSQLQATQAQLEQFRAEAETLRAENERQTRLTSLSAVVTNTDLYGANFAGDASRTAAQHLDSMNEEAREWVLQSFRSMYAVAKQGAASLQSDIGAEGEPEGTRYETVADEFNALAMRKIKEAADRGMEINYTAAVQMVTAERPDLAAAMRPNKGGG